MRRIRLQVFTQLWRKLGLSIKINFVTDFVITICRKFSRGRHRTYTIDSLIVSQ